MLKYEKENCFDWDKEHFDFCGRFVECTECLLTQSCNWDANEEVCYLDRRKNSWSKLNIDNPMPYSGLEYFDFSSVRISQVCQRKPGELKINEFRRSEIDYFLRINTEKRKSGTHMVHR